MKPNVTIMASFHVAASIAEIARTIPVIKTDALAPKGIAPKDGAAYTNAASKNEGIGFALSAKYSLAAVSKSLLKHGASWVKTYSKIKRFCASMAKKRS